jgi:uncharacterized protein (DUF427 family)
MAQAPGFAKRPDHRVEIAPAEGRLTVHAGNCPLAASDSALVVDETGYRRVFYLPLADVDARFTERTSHSTYCPFKGHASYWSVHTGDTTLDNVMWGYEIPYDECAALAGMVAFYADRVTLNFEPAGA